VKSSLRALELKVPPPVLALLLAAAMWGASHLEPQLAISVPLRRAIALVATGVYQVTRNPMYVGLACMLVAWAIFLGAPWPFIGPVLFVLYVNRFQIEPEERILARLFGEPYASYTARVRRWL
jgi:protein-S-isoprenylcysteine O-methyltransferase Ste14